MPWNVTTAVNHSTENAEPNSIGRCAQYTREAIEAGGVTLARHGSAEDYGPSLVTVGFTEYAAEPPGGFRAGDVAVIQGFDGHPHGHMQMYNGTAWVSDFSQRDFWPGPAYRTEQPAFTIFRHGAAVTTQTLSNTPGVKPFPGIPLRLGSKGPDVRAVQDRLKAGGANLTPDAHFGPLTHNAVVAFQRAHRLTPDGVVGRKTWAAVFGS
jgi:hypothetical protein